MSRMHRRAPQQTPMQTAPPDEEIPGMWIQLLGRFCVTIGTRIIEEVDWPLQKASALVKLLALAPGHRLAREQVMDLLRPDLNPAAAANNFHRTLASACDTVILRLPHHALALQA